MFSLWGVGDCLWVGMCVCSELQCRETHLPGKKQLKAVERREGKIVDKMRKAVEQHRPFYSFEYFPPKTEAGVLNLYER